VETKPLTPNMEMYLKTIYEIVDEGNAPRVKAIAERLGVKMPSVSGALETLQTRGLVAHDRYGDVRLTTKGRRVAREVKSRNDLIHRFLLEVLRLPPATASREACVLEHVVSPKTLERLSAFLEFLRVCNRGATETIAHFGQWLDCSEHEGECRACAEHGSSRCTS
jgi:DtxR family transcriptional regulator, Mn-dependent transcriptional regulator